jgi:hypothetical protein
VVEWEKCVPKRSPVQPYEEKEGLYRFLNARTTTPSGRAGFNFQRPLPEADAINYVTRVTQPTLMLNGELDFYFPRETSQRPEHKRWMTFPGAHSVPRVEMVREVLGWLARYLAKG